MKMNLESRTVVCCGSNIWNWGGSRVAWKTLRQGGLSENVFSENVFCLCLISDHSWTVVTLLCAGELGMGYARMPANFYKANLA